MRWDCGQEEVPVCAHIEKVEDADFRVQMRSGLDCDIDSATLLASGTAQDLLRVEVGGFVCLPTGVFSKTWRFKEAHTYEFYFSERVECTGDNVTFEQLVRWVGDKLIDTARSPAQGKSPGFYIGPRDIPTLTDDTLCHSRVRLFLNDRLSVKGTSKTEIPYDKLGLVPQNDTRTVLPVLKGKKFIRAILVNVSEAERMAAAVGSHKSSSSCMVS